MNSELAKNELKSLLRTKFAKPLNSQKSFEELAELTNLSAQTLRRFFGKIEQNYNYHTFNNFKICWLSGLDKLPAKL